MLWKIILAGLAFYSGLQQNSEEYPANWRVKREKWEPQTPAEELAAAKALQRKGGDMILPRGQSLGNSWSDTRFRWPGYPGSGKVPYVIDKSIDSKYHDVINRAIEQYNKLTCVKFTKWKNEKDYLRILKHKTETGCFGYVGKIGGEQMVSLGDGCYYIGTIVHELGHTLGFLHEHQRSDRDTYVSINTTNIVPEFVSQFRKMTTKEEVIYTPFYHNSIMIYGNYAFSKQWMVLPTMTAKNGERLTEPFNKPGLSNIDIKRTNMMYGCKP